MRVNLVPNHDEGKQQVVCKLPRYDNYKDVKKWQKAVEDVFANASGQYVKAFVTRLDESLRSVSKEALIQGDDIIMNVNIPGVSLDVSLIRDEILKQDELKPTNVNEGVT